MALRRFLFGTIGTTPMAIRAPHQGGSGSRIAWCETPNLMSRLSSFSRAASLSTPRATAWVPEGSDPGADSPAAWMSCEARTPRGRSRLTMQTCLEGWTGFEPASPGCLRLMLGTPELPSCVN